MCYRLHRTWGCGAPNHHTTVHAIICANPCPCDNTLGSDRHQHFPDSYCESCSGEKFPRYGPTSDEWSGNPAANGPAVVQYLNQLLGLANGLLHAAQSDCAASRWQAIQFEADFFHYYPLLLQETTCRAHNSSECGCTLSEGKPNGWVYNMAAAIRQCTANFAIDKYLVDQAFIFNPKKIAGIDTTKQSSRESYARYGKNNLVNLGYKPARMPFFCERSFLERYGHFVIHVNACSRPGHPKQEAYSELAKFLGLVVLADCGLSTVRQDALLGCVLNLSMPSRHVEGLNPATLAATDGLIMTSSPVLVVRDLLRWATGFLASKNRELRRVLVCHSMTCGLLERSVEVLDGELLLPKELSCPLSPCRRPFESANGPMPKPEPAVRPLTCNCAIGRSCLFKALMRQSFRPSSTWGCPVCGTEIANLEKVLAVPTRSLDHITEYLRLPRELQHDENMRRLFAEKSPMTEYWRGYMSPAVASAWAEPAEEPPTDPKRHAIVRGDPINPAARDAAAFAAYARPRAMLIQSGRG
jgi:hypothetical protein